MRSRSTRFWAACLALGMLGCLAAAATLTKDDVLAMARAGRGDQAILEAIRTSHSGFDLTADDIAELRRAGVGESVIQAMVDTAPPQSDLGSGASPAPEAATSPDRDQPADQGQDQSAYGDEGQGPLYGPYAPPAWYAYPYYPMYYPVYYPVYDPFWPFFGGFFVSFEFVHCSRSFSIFPCDRSVVVVNNPVPIRGTSFVRGRPTVFTTPRTLPRGATSIGAPLTASGAPTTRIASRPARLLAPRGMAGARVPGTARFAAAPRGVMAPAGRPAPRAVMSPALRPAPRPMAGPAVRAWPRPAPRLAAPPRPAPRFAPMPHGGFGGGGFHPAPAPRGGGHAHGGHH